MSQLEYIGKMMREKRLERIGIEAESRALAILKEAETKGEIDSREIARKISEAVKDLIDDRNDSL